MPREHPIDIDRLRKLVVTDGLSAKEAAFLMGVTSSAIWRRCVKYEIFGAGLHPVARMPDTTIVEIISMWRDGKSLAIIQAALNVPHGSIQHLLTTRKLWGAGRFYEPAPEALPPPSLAMLRLAEFDPVIARAVKLRLGKEEPDVVDDE